MERLLKGYTKKDGPAALVLVYAAALLTLLEYRYLPTVVQERLNPLLSSVSLEAGVTWALACVVGYLVIPLVLMLVVHRRPPSDIGFRAKGFLRHLWIYLACYAVMVPVLFYVADQPKFADTYPFVYEAKSSLPKFIRWELAYIAQFIALEAFFRGYLLFNLEKRMGYSSVLVMTVPYCMIHYHKPMIESFGAIGAGIVLGSLALKYRSWYGGALLHILVAVTMDSISAHRAGLF